MKWLKKVMLALSVLCIVVSGFLYWNFVYESEGCSYSEEKTDNGGITFGGCFSSTGLYDIKIEPEISCLIPIPNQCNGITLELANRCTSDIEIEKQIIPVDKNVILFENRFVYIKWKNTLKGMHDGDSFTLSYKTAPRRCDRN